MVNFTCQFDLAMECPNISLNFISERVSVRVFLEEINVESIDSEKQIVLFKT